MVISFDQSGEGSRRGMNTPFEEIDFKNSKLLMNYLDKTIASYKTLFTLNPDAIFILDSFGHVVRVNLAFERLLGYSIEESLQQKLQSLIVKKDMPKTLDYFHSTLSGQIHNYDCSMINKNGEILWINVTNIPISINNQILGVYTVAKDVSHFKNKREEVEKIEAFYRILTENVLDIMIHTKINGDILYVSPSCERILGYSPNEMVNRNHLSFIHADEKKEACIIREGVLTRQEHGRYCYRFRKKDGHYVWVESLCKPIMDPKTNKVLEVISVVRDITERITAEEELKMHNNALSNLIEHSPDAVILVKNQKIHFINETGVKLLGALRKEDLINASILKIIHSDYHQIAIERMEKIRSGVTTEFLEYKIVRLDGTILDAEIKATPTIFQNEFVKHMIIRDMTQRKQTQELIVNSEKLAIAGKMAAGIAHEVRNPLTAIKGFIQLMSEKSDQETYFDIIESEIDRIEGILSELLLLAKPNIVTFEKEDLKTLIQDVKTLINTQAIMNNVQIEIKSESEQLLVPCNKNQLKQVFINFLKNSIEAMENGGIITIEIKKYSTNKIKILIKDTGSGIPEHVLTQIGEPFFTTKEHGTGLGIMISKQIIENHQGNVHFLSDETGTTVEVILPLS